MRSGSHEHTCWINKWLVLACAFCNYVLINGVLFSFGILFVELLDTFKAGKSVTAWIGSLQAGVFNLAGIIAGSAARRFGIMKTIMAGTLLSSTGLFCSSFATNIYILYATYGFLPGLGFIMMGLPSVVAVSQNFDTQQSLAIGITQAGGSVGGFLFNPVIQIFIENFGWNGAVLLMSAIVLHGIHFGLLIHSLGRRKGKTEKENKRQDDCEHTKVLLSQKKLFVDPVQSDTLTENSKSLSVTGKSDMTQANASELLDGSEKEENEQTNPSVIDEPVRETLKYDNGVETPYKNNTNKCLLVLNQLVPYQVLEDRASLIFLISALIRSFAFFTPFVLLPDLAVENHINIEKAVWLASVMGISGAVGRIFLGWIADFQCVDRLYLYIFCLLGGGVLSGVAPSFSLYGLLMIYACIFGFAMGGECSLTPVICSDVAGKDKLAEMYGMLQTLCGIGVTCGTPFSGWLFEKTGGYSVSFIVAGTLITVSGVLLLPLKCQNLLNNSRNK